MGWPNLGLKGSSPRPSQSTLARRTSRRSSTQTASCTATSTSSMIISHGCLALRHHIRAVQCALRSAHLYRRFMLPICHDFIHVSGTVTFRKRRSSPPGPNGTAPRASEFWPGMGGCVNTVGVIVKCWKVWRVEGGRAGGWRVGGWSLQALACLASFWPETPTTRTPKLRLGLGWGGGL